MFTNIFPRKKPIIGVVRLLPLLGYPDYPGLDEIIKTGLKDIYKLEKAGFDGALVDNHTHPHVIKSTAEMTASFATVMVGLVKKSHIPLGVQFLIDDPEASLAIAKISGANFIRTDFFVDNVKTEYGLIKPKAKKIIAYRKKIFAQNILIFADVQVKHAEMVDKKKGMGVSVKQALSAGADAIIVTGSWTGFAPELKKLINAKNAAWDNKVLIGSGLTSENAKDLLHIADGALVGTSVRDESRIDYKKAKKLMKQVKKNLKGTKMANNEMEGLKLIDIEPVMDFMEIKNSWEKEGVSDLTFLGSGHMNLSWSGIYKGDPVICQFGPSLGVLSGKPLKGVDSSGFLNANKWDNAMKVSNIAKSSGIPVPEILETGFSEKFLRAWCIVEPAKGVNLDGCWESFSSVDKAKVLEQCGNLVGKLHSIPIEGNLPNLQEWYHKWFAQVAHNLEVLSVYDRKTLTAIKKSVLLPLLQKFLPPKFTFTHGDLLQKNFFVDPKAKDISSIIDWETTKISNPWADIVLAAWWMSGEYGGNENEYKSVIDGYNSGLSDKKLALTLQAAKEMNPYLDVLWYLNILWVRPLMGDHSQTERRKGMVEKIISELK